MVCTNTTLMDRIYTLTHKGHLTKTDILKFTPLNFFVFFVFFIVCTRVVNTTTYYALKCTLTNIHVPFGPKKKKGKKKCQESELK